MKKIISKIVILLIICVSIFGIITYNKKVNAAYGRKTENDLLREAYSDDFYRNNYNVGTQIEWGGNLVYYPQGACMGHYGSSGSGYSGYYGIQTIIDINLEGGHGTGYVKIRDYINGTNTTSGSTYGAKIAASIAYATLKDRYHNPFGGIGYRDGSFALKNNLISAIENSNWWKNSIYPGYVKGGKQNDWKNAWDQVVRSWAYDIPSSIPEEDPRITFLKASSAPSIQKDIDGGTWIGPYIIENIGGNKIATATAIIDSTEKSAVAWRVLKSDGTYSVNTNISGIPNKTEFWLKFNENFEMDQVGKVAIRGKTLSIYQARLIMLGYPKKGNQCTAIYRGRWVQGDVGTDIEVEFGIIETKTSLSIAKEGANGGALSGVQFKIYDEKREQYLKDATGSKTTWVDDFKDAKIYETDESGVVNVGKFDTNKEGPLTIIELGVGNNGNYSDPLILESASIGTVGTKVIDGTTYPVVTGVKITGSTLKVTVKDTKTSTDLKITKQDKKTGKTIKGVEFKVLLEKAKYIDELSNMWVTQGGTGTVNFTNDKHDKYLSSDPNNAGKFITGDDGYTLIKGIVAGTYHIYETKLVPYYDMEAQKGYDEQKQWIDCGTIELPGNSSGVNITVENIPTRGDIEIQKKDSKKDDVEQVGAKFKIQLIESKEIPRMNGKWLTTTNVGSNDKFDYTNVQNGKYDYANYENDSYFTDNVQNAGEFITGPGTKINITGLLNGRYHIYEIDAAEGYKIEEQDGYGKDSRYPTWVDCGEFTVESWEDNKCIVNNDKIVVKIEGNVWLDIPNISIKDTPEYNGLIDDTPDKKLGRNNSLSKR